MGAGQAALLSRLSILATFVQFFRLSDLEGISPAVRGIISVKRPAITRETSWRQVWA